MLRQLRGFIFLVYIGIFFPKNLYLLYTTQLRIYILHNIISTTESICLFFNHAEIDRKMIFADFKILRIQVFHFT